MEWLPRSHFFMIMKKRLTIGFLFSTLLLVVFEYILLNEVYAAKRPSFIIVGIAGIVLAAVFFIFFFIKYRKAPDES
jgi:uncharacterized membrane protein YuzA (DUF378 family)